MVSNIFRMLLIHEQWTLFLYLLINFEQCLHQISMFKWLVGYLILYIFRNVGEIYAWNADTSKKIYGIVRNLRKIFEYKWNSSSKKLIRNRHGQVILITELPNAKHWIVRTSRMWNQFHVPRRLIVCFRNRSFWNRDSSHVVDFIKTPLHPFYDRSVSNRNFSSSKLCKNKSWRNLNERVLANR